MREKKHYIAFQVISKNTIPYYNLKNAIFDSLLDYMGEGDFSKANIRLIKNLYRSGKGFIQCHPKYVDAVKMSMALISQIADERVILRTIRVSGTIKGAKK